MSTVNITPNMNLPNPVPGVDSGPDYADNLESSLNQIDQHNHSAGQGVLIQPNGINISSDLPFGGNNATALRSVRLESQSAPITNTAPDVGILYVSGNELWYNDYTGGNQVQITVNGLINATSSGISSGTATAAFSAGVLVVKSSSTSFANIDVQSVVLANAGNLVNQLTLLAPTLSSSYDLTLPSVPLTLSILTVDTSGVMGYTMNATVADPVGQAMSSTGANAVANSRTRTTGTSVGVGGVALSASCGNPSITSTAVTGIVNLQVDIVTSGRPVFVGIVQDGSGQANLAAAPSSNLLNIYFRRDLSAVIMTSQVSDFGEVATSIFYQVDFPSAGSHHYEVLYSLNAPGSGLFPFSKLVAYEL